MNRYKSTGNRDIFDEQENVAKLSAIGNPLEMVISVVDFEMFRDTLEEALLNKDKKSNAGAKPYDVVMMFKILILQCYYGLGDSQLEYQIIDRTSFKKFLGLESGDKIPDEKTVWAFREKLTNEVHEKGHRNSLLTEEQKANNREKLKTRARVEHVFGFMEQSMNGLIVKSVGIKRATGIIGLINLTYNLFRYEQVIQLNILN